jgi:NADPH:quinone reductase-like Zn-dependent oxidoreductase
LESNYWDARIVKEVGADVTLLRLAMKSGMQAISLVKHAQYQIVDERIVGTKPSSLSYAEAAFTIDNTNGLGAFV